MISHVDNVVDFIVQSSSETCDDISPLSRAINARNLCKKALDELQARINLLQEQESSVVPKRQMFLDDPKTISRCRLNPTLGCPSVIFTENITRPEISSCLSFSEFRTLQVLNYSFRQLVPTLVDILDFSSMMDDYAVTVVTYRFRQATIVYLKENFRLTNGVLDAFTRLRDFTG